MKQSVSNLKCRGINERVELVVIIFVIFNKLDQLLDMGINP
jgi:hypothetical protein